MLRAEPERPPQVAVVRLTEEEIEFCERFAAERGVPALLDHLGLDGLGNLVARLPAGEPLWRSGELCMDGAPVSIEIPGADALPANTRVEVVLYRLAERPL